MARPTVDPLKDSRLNMKRPECFHCLNALWSHSPGKYWYPTFRVCKLGDECEPNPMTASTRNFITSIYMKYSKEGRIRELCK